VLQPPKNDSRERAEAGPPDHHRQPPPARNRGLEWTEWVIDQEPSGQRAWRRARLTNDSPQGASRPRATEVVALLGTARSDYLGATTIA
jgi:hypothetical protein